MPRHIDNSHSNRPFCVGLRPHRTRRAGKILVLLAVLLPTLMGIIGLVVDGGLMMADYRTLQHAADAAATAAAMNLKLGKDAGTATATAIEVIQISNSMPSVSVTVNIPPSNGLFAGLANHVEVIAD